MAKTELSTVTHQVLEEIGQEGPITCIVSGADIFPGSIVTQTGETISTATIDIPGAANEVTLGIVGLLPNHDIKDAYAAGDIVEVYRRGSGTKAWGHITAGNGNGKQGTPYMHNHAGANGYALVSTDTEHLEYLGILHKDVVVDATDDTPALFHLQ